PLMRNVRTENVSEHSLQVAFVAHALEVGGQAVLGRQEQHSDKVAMPLSTSAVGSSSTPWLTERHGYDPTSGFPECHWATFASAEPDCC
ncbi:YfbR-like 5'-deoxynucleotidase, partial [Yersinia nurmii]|uniref:YfbR-like 5'-deoxynucleotidase n=1 Tax=Yersinia nurmii TaxID=685706 RepID=UPI003EBD0C69